MFGLCDDFLCFETHTHKNHLTALCSITYTVSSAASAQYLYITHKHIKLYASSRIIHLSFTSFVVVVVVVRVMSFDLIQFVHIECHSSANDTVIVYKLSLCVREAQCEIDLCGRCVCFFSP